MLWGFATEMIAKGYPVEHIAQASGAAAMMLAEQAFQGDLGFVKAIIAETVSDLQSGSYGS